MKKRICRGPNCKGRVVESRTATLDEKQPFPFVVEGHNPALNWHVVTAAAPAPGQHGGADANRHTATHVFDQPQASGRLASIYSGEALEGVVSHPGERFHVHFVDLSPGFSRHVDAYAVARGATLKLPLR